MMKQTLFAAVSGLALLSSAAGALAEDVVLRFSNWLPPTHPIITQMIEPWAAEVEAATEGRVSLQILPALGAPGAHFDMVRNGVADIAFGVHGYTPERFKLTEMVELPFTSENAQVNSIANWRTYQQFFMDANEHEGTHLLGLWVPGSYQLFTRAGVETVEDLDGLRIRVPGSTVERIATELGMVSISSPLTEAYDQISRGIIDGMFQTYSTVRDFNMAEHMPVVMAVPGGFAASSQFLVISDAAWDRISPEDQAAIDALSGETMVRQFAEVWQAQNAAAVGELVEGGLTQIELSGTDLEMMQERLAPIWDQWIADANERGVDAEAAIAFYQEQLDAVAEELGVERN
ncbi:TRAP transporter substrate-binding protein [Rhodobacter sp. NTK016B]|uniref:TRAP transporter substrate-binding protein n=1 Tax=Rhodobacter sp. NTK016B TaxID=2759676 RepID=UPI001A8DC9D4|nr:TRAP transporter substrate-binding protein [Rhodobacter sp. NTK016B]MBN8290998.1 TRAP transporter substrate-binding protein [Rhodobacter sp. NTK016B]